MKYIKALALVAALMPAGAAWAETKQELAQAYNDLPAVQQMMEAMFSAEGMAAQFRAGLPPGMQVTDEQALRVGAVMSETMVGLQPKMEALMIEATAEVFSEDEIRAMIDFYSSEHGAQILLKTQPMFQKVMSELTPSIMQAMAAKQGEIAKILSE
ncbi:MAG: DUF2059 domain-containing protein [Silicimonas sp.]|nr:DUF2059 domain-containing protein [Silicimonas sp.]